MSDTIQYQTFEAFHTAIKAEVAPEGLADNLVTPFRSWVGVSLSEIQLFIPLLRTFNARFITKEMVNEFCGTSIFQGPVGKITQLFAYKPFKDCKKLYYKRVSTAEIDCWMERQRCLCPATTPPQTDVYLSPYCNYVIPGEDACGSPYLNGDEDDCRFKSLDDDVRVFSVGPDYKVYAAPRFPCNYVLLLQWQGINRTWVPSDLVPIDNLLQQAVASYCEHRVFMKEHQGATSGYYDAYVDMMRTLRKRFDDEFQTPPKRDCTSAIAQIQSAFIPGYMSPVYGPGQDQTLFTEGGVPLILE